MTQALDDLVRILDLEPIEVNIFRGASPDENRQRVFGGQVAGQALVAAARTVRPPAASSTRSTPTSCDPATRPCPILYEVDRIRDGRSFTTRRVVAIQHGQAIFNLQASFHADEVGLDHQVPMPDVPDPESLPDFRTRMAPYKDVHGRLVRPAPAHRHPLRRALTPTRARKDRGHHAAGVAARRRRSCPTIPCSTPASSPTRRT